MEGLVASIAVPFREVLLGNLHYDLLKLAFGCSAIAYDTVSGPVLARNLDWFSNERILEESTLVSRFVGGDAGEFVTVG